ncbi:response regulator [Spirosoma gilvum]
MIPIRLLLVDDHPMILEGLRILLQPIDYLDIVATASSAAQALTTAAICKPDVVLLDINLPDLNGIQLCQCLTTQYPHLKVLALTSIEERSYLIGMLQAGAVGYVLKNASTDELAKAITKVHAGKKYFSPSIQELLLECYTASASPELLLTRREKEVLSLIAQGLTSTLIAQRLSISILTVETHRRNLLLKFKVNNVATLIKQAMLIGLV